MTRAQQTESLLRSRTSARELPLSTEHDALNETATMSSHGPREYPSVAIRANESPATARGSPSTVDTKDAQTQTVTFHSNHSNQTHHDLEQKRFAKDKKAKGPTHRIQFGEFAEQLRQQQYFENRKKTLQERKRVLQKTITLSARLHRVSSWIGDGLVEISEEPDAVGFVHLHQHMQNLIDLSHSQWDNELHALDPLGKHNPSNSEIAGNTNIISKFSGNTMVDLLDLISHLRSNPRFLVARFKALASAQIVTLWSAPRYHKQTSEGSEFNYLPRGRRTQQRIQSYSRLLEDYASSFERANPLAFLLFNMYGTNQSSIDAENQLRLSTWSAVCAELMVTSRPAYSSLALQLLDCFASLYEWRARDSVEMFLMDILQRGAFLLEDSSNARRFPGRGPIITSAAQEFFDEAVHKLFEILVKHEGGFPTGASQLASAVLHKLPLLEQQMDFRGMFFGDWFLNHFLRLALSYPENENMLLKFHVSNAARQKILVQLCVAIQDRVHDVYSEQPARPVDDDFRFNVETIVGTVDLVESINPYSKNEGSPLEIEDHAETSITISVPEIIQVLEALSPQAIHGVKSDHYLFERGSIYGYNLQANSRFDRLKADLLQQVEPGLSPTEVHPCQEQWLQLDIDRMGKPKLPQTACPHTDGSEGTERDDLDCAQQAALRLFKDRVSESTALSGTNYRSDLLQSPSLENLFREMEIYTSARLDPIGSLYWAKAIDTLREKYPLSIFMKNDSAVLQKIFENSKAAQAQCRECCSKLEIQMSVMEGICLKIRSTINKCVERFESLRLKIWYTADVVLSKHYDDAKNIARALNHMADLNGQNVKSSSSSFISNRPMSSASSMFNQPYEDTVNMMKASSVNGGPGKLADKQIELTQNWLERTHIENFCKGEERIHRFCMEVYNVAKSIVGETLTEAPVLWSSELFARERSLYDVRSFGITSAPASTRPASIISDTISTSHRFTRPVASLRMALEDRRPNISNKINRDCLPLELASSIGSLSRAHSATTAESVSSIFSPLPSNARSLTSGSVYSRTSVFNDPILNRFTDTTKAKTKFLDKVHQVLICLLLSDLGCPVWSCGSETDAMLESSRENSAVNNRLKRRMLAETLAGRSQPSGNQQKNPKLHSRSKSISIQFRKDRVPSIPNNNDFDYDGKQDETSHLTDHLVDLSELLQKMSQQVDPVEKLVVAEEFYELSLTTLGDKHATCTQNEEDCAPPITLTRRHSIGDQTSKSHLQRQEGNETSSARIFSVPDTASVSAHQIVQHLKSDLARLPSKTLFRDLQYISAFVPSDHTDNTTRGKALLQLGLAALAYKDEMCRSMVDVAHDMFSQNRASTFERDMMPKIAEFWVRAAREGNAVAQRELASLYLSRPDLLPIVSLPLFKTSQIFKADMLWYGRSYHNKNTQALCLALHWMQQASANGDKLARHKLEERSAELSIR